MEAINFFAALGFFLFGTWVGGGILASIVIATDTKDYNKKENEEEN